MSPSVSIFGTLLAGALFAQTNAPWTIQRLPDTGQTRHYSTARGDDADITINPPAFTRVSDGVVKDLVTGLEWRQADGGEMTWDAAVTYCKGLGDNWRLPSAQELFTIQHHGAINPALDTAVFTRSNAEYWWSADKRSDNPAFAWATNAGGGIGAHPLTETLSAGGTKRFHARCVRHAAVGNGLPEPYTDHGDGTVTDNRTGLMWQKVEQSAAISWEEGLAAVTTLRLGGHDDWRVPNIKELRSLHSDATVRPSIDTRYFPATAPAIFWSSTTQIGQNGVTAWTLDFSLGVVSYNPKGDRLHLRAVRGGAGPRLAFGGIRHAASFGDGPVAPEEIVALFGTEFPADAVVRMNGTSALLIGGTATQLNTVVPAAVAQSATVAIEVEGKAGRSPTLVVPLAAAAPALFTRDSSGTGAAAAFNQDSTLNTPANPARRGALLVLFGTGRGILPDAAVEVRIGDNLCEILYSGGVPGLPAGLLQLNVRIPADIAPGAAIPVVVKVGDARSPAGVTVSIA